MTDKEIIQALECCIKPTSDCDNCTYYGYDDDLQCFDMSKRDALDLINRQQAENERLQVLLDGWKTEAYKLSDSVDNVKSEAIKEFAERLKSEMIGKFCLHFDGELTNAIIDKVLKEKE